MNKNLKKVLVPFILAVIINIGCFYLSKTGGITAEYFPYYGIPIITAILFGPYGILGALIGNLTGDLLVDLTLNFEISFEIITNIIIFGVSYLAYKLWYVGIGFKKIATQPKFSDTSKILEFLGILLICSLIFGLLIKKLFVLNAPYIAAFAYDYGVMGFFNIFNTTFIFGIIGIRLSKYIDFVHIPKKSNRKEHNTFYNIIFILLIVLTLIILITDFYLNKSMLIGEIDVVIIITLLLLFITKPMTITIVNITYDTLPEKIMNIFLLTTTIVLIIGYIICLSLNSGIANIINSGVDTILPIDLTISNITVLILVDIALLIFFIPTIIVLRYIERKFINPITSFSKIEKYIEKGDRIESEGLIDVYSKYINENNEIGMLARSYTDLINYTNEYIDNIHEIKGEKQRIEAELNIAERIQKSNLPTEPIENEFYSVFGYSRPAKEVGGDFYDYYEIDEDNVAIVIGDASGKGVPAALLSTITQSIIKQILKNEKDPSKALYKLNNQICENNSEFMFITLWLGIYNRNTDIVTFSNAGHDAPLVNKNGAFEKIKMNKGIVLGVMEDFEYVREETPLYNGLITYTDGITDAKNSDGKFYGDERLIDFLNNNEFNKDTIKTLMNNLDEFIEGANQFDDMTLLTIEKHN